MQSDGSTLLVVDGDRKRMGGLAELLASRGFEVRSVASGELALAAVSVWLPSLILLSVRLPDIDGFEVLRRLRKQDQARNIPVIFTGVSPDGDGVQGLALGAVDFIAAAMPGDEVVARIRAHLEAAGVREERQYMLERTSAELRSALRQLQSETAERYRIETAMRKREEVTLLAMQVCQTYTFEWNPKTHEVTRSPESVDLLGLGEAIREHWTDSIQRVHPDDRSTVLRRIQQLSPAYDTCECDYRLVRSDGRVVHLHSVIRGFFDRSGEPERYIGVVADTTRARQAEAALARTEERFRSMADSAPMMICASGPDRLATYFNRAWLSFTGRTMEQELGYGWTDGLHEDDRERVMAGYAASFAAHRNCHLEYRLRRSDGEYRWISCSGVPRWSADGAFAGYIASCNDITDLKRAQVDAFDKQKLESMRLLAGGIAHDLSNLLSAIQMQAELVEAEASGGMSPELSIRRLRSVATRAAEIVRELMIYAGEDKATLEPISVSRVIEEMLELLRASVSKHARLEADLAEHLPAVLANTTQIRQVVMNLVINASEAIGDKDGTIRIATSTARVTEDPFAQAAANPPEGDYVRIEIADTGSGMSEEARRRVFDRSFTTKAAGHGLGLAVVQGIVRSHGGVVNVTSALGHGTTFEVLLPCAGNVAGSVPRMAPAMALDSINTGTKAALLIEREEHLRMSVAKALRRRGFSVLSATDSEAAEDIVRNRGEDIDVVILDLATRGSSRADDLSRLRRLRPSVPVILTGDEPGAELTGTERGVSFLRKPYRIAELLESLRNAIGDAEQAPSHTEVAEAGSD